MNCLLLKVQGDWVPILSWYNRYQVPGSLPSIVQGSWYLVPGAGSIAYRYLLTATTPTAAQIGTAADVVLANTDDVVFVIIRSDFVLRT